MYYVSRLISRQSSFLVFVLPSLLLQSLCAEQSPNDALVERQAKPANPLVDFQVYEPILTPSGSSDEYGCVYTQQLMSYVFANSYGAPFVGTYTPPPCSFNRITMNFTVTAKGRQFDRLGLMFLGDIEVFRTSTAEPTANGIVWTYIKEMEQYTALWNEEQKIIFDLPNIVNDIYTAPLVATLTATFFTVPDTRAIADTILPISSRKSAADMGSFFTVPGQTASVSYKLPQNVERAVVSLSACGQQAEEFWYTNVLSSDVDTFANTTGQLYGFSPFREVQLLIDGQLGGVSWPFPIIFTGGIVPGFWRPIVGIDAFDLRQHEIDITPWLALLCDGNPHTFEIRVVGLNNDGASHATLSETVGAYWVVTGTIFLFLSKSDSTTTGSPPIINTSPPQIQISSSVTTNATGANETLSYNTAVSRSISITSSLGTWSQNLSYTNLNALTSQGLIQYTSQSTTGTDKCTSSYANTYSYPLIVNSSFSVSPSGAVSINGSLTRGLTYDTYGSSIFPSGIETFNTTTPNVFTASGVFSSLGTKPSAALPSFSGALLSTTQTAKAEYLSAGNASYSFGTTEQDFDFKGAELTAPDTAYELYHRHVKAINTTIVEDEQSLAGQTFGVPVGAAGEELMMAGSQAFSVRGILGRGPGQAKEGFSGPGTGK